MLLAGVSKPDQNGWITVTTDQYSIRLMPRITWETNAGALYVDDDMACAADPELARLTAEEAALGDLRWCDSVREGGSHPKVDALYVALNERHATVSVAIASEALRYLGGIVTGDLDTAVSDAYFSRNAGCRDCPCSPGVVVPGNLRINGRLIDISVGPR